MKLLKHISLVLSLVMLSLLTNCSSDNDNEEVNYIERDYFTIVNGSYINNGLPSGTAELVSDFNINNYVINGGSTIIDFTSTKVLKSLNIGVKGISGYYEVKLSETKSKSEITKGNYQYEVVLNINQNIAVQDFKLELSVTSADGETSPITESKEVSVIEAGTGKLQVTLSWDQEDDLDLHVITPDGDEIAFSNEILFSDGNEIEDKFYFNFYAYLVGKYTNHDTSKLDYNNEDDHTTLGEYLEELEDEEGSEVIYKKELSKYIQANNSGIIGYLDIDSNASCNIDGIKNENIFFNEVQNGEYTIIVNLYKKCDYSEVGAKYSVTLNYNGKAVKFSENQLGQFAQDDQGSYNTPSKYVIIGKFTINDAKSTVVKTTTKNNKVLNRYSKYFSKKK